MIAAGLSRHGTVMTTAHEARVSHPAGAEHSRRMVTTSAAQSSACRNKAPAPETHAMQRPWSLQSPATHACGVLEDQRSTLDRGTTSDEVDEPPRARDTMAQAYVVCCPAATWQLLQHVTRHGSQQLGTMRCSERTADCSVKPADAARPSYWLARRVPARFF